MESHFEDVKQQILQKVQAAIKVSNPTESFWGNVQAFANAVDWKEPWIIALLVGQVIAFLLVLLNRRNTTFLSVAFGCLGFLIYFGESINRIAAQHWDGFATQNYFDSNGIFYSVVVSGPALVTLFAVLIFYLLGVVQLMVVVKKKELIHKARSRTKAAKETQSAAVATKED